MSTPENNPQIEALLQQGIEAAHTGNNEKARALFEQVIEMDEHNEKAWFWLAAVVENDEEKRVCLGNVIIINPGNKRAQDLLDQLEGKKFEAEIRKPEEHSGASRKSVYLAIGLGAVAVIALLIVLFTMMGGGNDENKQASTPDAPSGVNQPPGASGILAQDVTTFPTTPTQSPTLLPPTWTPVPTVTPQNHTPATPLAAPPPAIRGKIIMEAGDTVGDIENHPLVLVNANGSNQRPITHNNERGHDPVLSPDGSQVAYIQYTPGTRAVILLTNNLQGTDPVWSSVRWGGIPILTDQNMPDWSSDGNWIAFTALGPGVSNPDLYRVSVAPEDASPEALQQLTSDQAVESWPSFSPESRWIVYSARYSTDEKSNITELRICDTETGIITNLTTNGDQIVETAPDWSPDGKFVLFQGQESDASESDIYQMPADGSQPPKKIIDSDAQDIRPRYSPDGRYIVFSSNRTGNWDVFVYEIATHSLYQVTSDPQTEIANDWGR